MNVQTGVVGAAPPADPPSSAGPPGDPPEAFGEVLGATLQKLDGPSQQASTRTARAEGAREQSGAEDQASSDAAAGQTGDEVAPSAVTKGDTASEVAPAATKPEAAASPDELEDRLAGTQALATATATRETLPVAQPATVAAAPAEPTHAVAPGQGVLPATDQAAKPVAAALPAEPTHAVAPEQGVLPATDDAARLDSGVLPAAKPDAARLGQQVLQAVARGEKATDAPAPMKVGADPAPSLTQAPAGNGEHRRGDVAGGQTGTSPDGGQTPRQGASPLPTAAPVAQQATPTEAAVVAKAEAPLRARARLGELADVAQTLIRVAAKDGKTTARITLRPVELGEIEIRLRYHAGGVSADVVAESRQAAQLLNSASGELKKSLESQGLTVHWLDVRAGSEGRRDSEELGQPGGNRRSNGDAVIDEADELTTIEASSLPLAAGAVDVLA